jgi:hypothetical protein
MRNIPHWVYEKDGWFDVVSARLVSTCCEAEFKLNGDLPQGAVTRRQTHEHSAGAAPSAT